MRYRIQGILWDITKSKGERKGKKTKENCGKKRWGRGRVEEMGIAIRAVGNLELTILAQGAQ